MESGFFIPLTACTVMKYRLLIALFLFLFLIAFGYSLYRIITNKTPEKVVFEAKSQLAKAKISKAPKFARNLFNTAGVYYDSAMTEWNIQNEKFIVIRNYSKVNVLAQQSIDYSNQAIIKAKKAIANTEGQLACRTKEIGTQISTFEQMFHNFPLGKQRRKDLGKCKLLYSESIQAGKSKNYAAANAKLDTVESLINSVFGHCYDQLKNYFDDFSTWNKMVDRTISFSKKNKAQVFIIDKMARQLLIYRNGNLFKQYTIELGENWMGEKKQQGDKSTPEGLYKITDKKENGQTKYYKALLLNYPNDDDKKRFLLNKKSGRIAKNARIGNLIEIHGNGGKGIDWTNGCIALEDSDMDEVFSITQPGTNVTIVGSTKSLNELHINSKGLN